jgi:hypothetical protein
MNAPQDKNGKTISKGSYVKFNNNLWEVFDWYYHFNNKDSTLWLEPRAGNEFPAQWAYGTEMEVTDLQQLYFEL